MKSIEHRQKLKQRFWKQCKNGKLPSVEYVTSFPTRSSFWQLRIQLSKRELIRFLRPNKIGSCSKFFVEYPSFDDEFEIARRTTGKSDQNVKPVLTGEEIIELQETVREVPISDHVIKFALSLVRQTRVGSAGIPEFVQEMVGWGAGPRAVQFLILGGKARALLYGRSHVPPKTSLLWPNQFFVIELL